MKRPKRILSIVLLAIIGVAVSACGPKPVSSPSLTIANPSDDETIYAILDVYVVAKNVDPQTVRLWLDDGEPINATSMRVDTRTLEEGLHTIFTSGGGTNDRVDFVVTHDVPTPRPGSVLGLGDSITFQVTAASTAPIPALGDDNVFISFPGLRAIDLVDDLSKQVLAGNGQTVVVALGNNELSDGTWDDPDDPDNTPDTDSFEQLIGVVSPDACLALIAPGYGSTASQARKDATDSAVTHIQAIAAGHPNVTVVKWQDFIGPTTLRPSDAAHLNDEEGPDVFQDAKDARVSTFQAGIDACQELRIAPPADTTTVVPEDEPTADDPLIIESVPVPLPPSVAVA